MDYNYELIRTDEDLPIKIIYHTTDEPDLVASHWHDSIEICYVLSGKLDKIYIDGMEYSPQQGDILLINSNAIHSFHLVQGENRRTLSIFIPYDFVKASCANIDQMTFDCISIFEINPQRLLHFVELRNNLNSILNGYITKENDAYATIRITGLAYELVYLLLKNFSVSKKNSGVIKTKKYLDKLMFITSFIKSNYNNVLSIDIIASEFGLSNEYLSRFFIKHMGMTVLQYINAIRLENAYRDLMNTDHSILQITFDHGFPNEKSFNRVFKSIYHVTPNHYRKLNKSDE